MISKKNETEQKMDETKIPKKKNRFMLIFVCIFLAAVLLFGTVFGIIATVRQSGFLVKYGSYGFDSGEVTYLASYYKYLYKKSLNGIIVSDTAESWGQTGPEGKTYGELLQKGFEEYLSGILVSCNLFDDDFSLSASDREKIASIAEKPLVTYGSVEAFNKASSAYGFDYEDYKGCIEPLYKAAMARVRYFGADGSNLQVSDCLEFYEQYSHVALLFISDGYIYDEDGEYRPLTDGERAERETMTAALSEAVKSGTITVQTINHYYPDSDSDQDRLEKGYYLKRGAQSTDALAQNYPEAVSKAIEMERGEFAEVKCEGGVFFIHKYAEEELNRAHIDKENDPFFSDFFADAADYIFSSKVLMPLAGRVEFTDKFGEVDILSVPYNATIIFSVY